MLRRPDPRRLVPSPALAIAWLALAVALGGVGYAAATLPKNSVGSAQLRRNAVSAPKVRDRTLKRADLSAKAAAALRGGRGAAGLPGERGPAGGAGADGVPGPRGPASVLTKVSDQDVPLGADPV